MTVLGRGLTSPGAAPTTAKAKIFLTIPFTALRLALAGTGTLPGVNGCDSPDPAGSTEDGAIESGSAFTRPAGSRGSLDPQAPGWPAPGVGRTFTGEGLTPGQVRRLACQADLIPVVLGTGSEDHGPGPGVSVWRPPPN